MDTIPNSLAVEVENLVSFFDLPLPVLMLISVLLMTICGELGYRVGLLRRSHGEENAELGGGAIVVSAMFALLGLIIAFTYSSAVSRHEVRKAGVVEEANALGTAYLRANLVAEPGRSELKAALFEYTGTRFVQLSSENYKNTAERRIRLVERTIAAQAQIWPITQKIIESSPRGPIETSLMASVNEVLDMHMVRIAAAIDKLPDAVIVMLIFIAGASLAITGYNAGTQGTISRWRISLFAGVLSFIMVIIIDFDRPSQGMLRVNQAPILILYEDMKADMKLESSDP